MWITGSVAPQGLGAPRSLLATPGWLPKAEHVKNATASPTGRLAGPTHWRGGWSHVGRCVGRPENSWWPLPLPSRGWTPHVLAARANRVKLPRRWSIHLLRPQIDSPHFSVLDTVSALPLSKPGPDNSRNSGLDLFKRGGGLQRQQCIYEINYLLKAENLLRSSSEGRVLQYLQNMQKLKKINTAGCICKHLWDRLHLLRAAKNFNFSENFVNYYNLLNDNNYKLRKE